MASVLDTPQIARVALRAGRHIRLRVEITPTPAGLLAVGGLVAAILLSVPPIVRAAGEARRTPRGIGP